MYMYCIERISITGITRVNFVILLLAMVSLHMLTFRLMVTMVTKFWLISFTHSYIAGRDKDQYT